MELIGKYAQVKKERALSSNVKKLPNSSFKISKAFFKKYELEDEEFPLDFLMNSFHKIEFADPFPTEDYMMTNELDQQQNERVILDSKELIYPAIRVFNK